MDKKEEQKPVTRTKHNAFFLTEEDSLKLNEFAKTAGSNRGGGQMVTAIIERLIIGGFSPYVFFRVGCQLQKFAEENGRPYDGGFYFTLRPLPALPDEDIPLPVWKKEVKQLVNKLEKNTKQ